MRQNFCGPYAHCEHDEGYIVFNRSNGYEIWRRRVDVLGIPEEMWPSGLRNGPDGRMIEANRAAEALYLDPGHDMDPDHLRGQFVPWARLLIPENSQALKLARVTLLVAGDQKAFLYDVEKAELQQTIAVKTSGRLRYVDLSEHHIFLVSLLQVTIYDRGNGSCVLSIPAGRLPWDFYATPENQWRRTEAASDNGELCFRRTVAPDSADRNDLFHAGVWSRISLFRFG